MVKMTKSLSVFLIKYYPKKYITIGFGHLEDFTREMKEEYLDWCKTEEGTSYLKGGKNYSEY